MNYTLTNAVDWLRNQGWDPRIHIAANADLVNVFLIVTTRYTVLVDTLLNATTARALLDYAQPYLVTRPLLVINTHADWDHAWGNELFAGPKPLYPAPIIAHHACAARLRGEESRATLAAMQQENAELFANITLTPPTLTFADSLTIDGGDLTLHLVHTPGHTEDHIAIHIPEISTLLPGDAAEYPFPMPDSPQTLPTLRASLHNLAAFEATNALYCHAPLTSGPQLIHDNIAYYDTLERTCRTALTRGISITGLDDAALPAALDCPLTAVAPAQGAWQDLDQADLLERHGEQLRYMWEWLNEEIHA